MGRQIVCLVLSLGSVFVFWSAAMAADEADKLAQQVQVILKDKCADCHGNGTAEGGMDYVLSGKRLIERRQVVPGNAAGSKLYRLIRTGEMPKESDPLEKQDIETIKRWIDAGATDWNPPVTRTPILPSDALTLMVKDLDAIERRNPRDLHYIRYFLITHLYNAGYDETELETYRLALSKLVNSLSWGAKIVKPQPIDSAKTIFRIDLRHYKWTSATWQRILAENPYGIIYDTVAAKTCYEKTNCELPYIRGDWFVARAAIPPLYHDILEIPLTDRELEKRLQIDVAQNLASDQAARAAFNGSGVSSNNRLIERHVSDLTHGAYWKSYDFKPLREKQANGAFRDFPERNLFDRPLGPKNAMPNVRKPFQHAGGELIWNLPNGLQAYMLIDDQGKRIDIGLAATSADRCSNRGRCGQTANFDQEISAVTLPLASRRVPCPRTSASDRNRRERGWSGLSGAIRCTWHHPFTLRTPSPTAALRLSCRAFGIQCAR